MTFELNILKKTSSSWTVLVIVSIVQFLTPFLSSAVNIAIPQIGMDLSASANQLGLVQVVYTLAVTMLLLPAGRIGDIYGRKKVFITGTGIALLATIAAPFARSIEFFIFIRFFQGVGAAMINTTSLAILTAVFPTSKLGRIMGIVVGCVYIGLSAGPCLAGVIVTQLGWHWVFILMVPFEILALGLTVFRLKSEWRESRGEPFDWSGALIYIFAMSIAFAGLTRASASAETVLLFIFGVSVMAVFVYLQTRVAYPLIDIRQIIKNNIFIYGNLATFISYAASFSIVFLFSLYLQYAKGMSAQSAGLIMMVQPTTQAILSPLAGRLSDRFRSKRIMVSGMICITAGIFAASFTGNDTPVVTIAFELILLGIGFGLFSSPNMTITMSSVPPKLVGTASSAIATMRTQGTLVSIAVVSVVITYFLKDRPVCNQTIDQFIQSLQVSLKILSIMGGVGILFSLKMKTLENTGQ